MPACVITAGAEGEIRTLDLHVMSVALLPTELPRRAKFVAPPRIARGPAAYETAEVLFLQGAMMHFTHAVFLP